MANHVTKSEKKTVLTYFMTIPRHFIQKTGYPKDTLSKRQIIRGTNYPGTDYPKDTLSKRQIIQEHFIQWDTLSNGTHYPMGHIIQLDTLSNVACYLMGHIIQWDSLSNRTHHQMG